MGIPLTNNLGKYLGMPTIHGRISSYTYKHVLDRVYGKLARWKAHTLSLAGCITLIKSVTSSILVYAMQTAELPKSVCNAIDKSNKAFLWSDTKQKRGVRLVNWNEVCKPKKAGRLEIRSMK